MCVCHSVRISKPYACEKKIYMTGFFLFVFCFSVSSLTLNGENSFPKFLSLFLATSLIAPIFFFFHSNSYQHLGDNLIFYPSYAQMGKHMYSFKYAFLLCERYLVCFAKYVVLQITYMHYI